MAKAPGFSTHHKAAKQAFAAGDHGKAMHHIGHMMRQVKTAMKGAPPAIEGGEPAVTDMDDQRGTIGVPAAAAPQKRGLGNWLQGVATPGPGAKPTPTAPAKPSPSSRFAALKGR